MKRIIIICEGQTEQEFCNDILQPHFNQFGIIIQNPTIKKTAGGIVNWSSLKHQIETHLKQDQTAYITTLIDFYGIHANHNYPNWTQANKQTDKNIGMDLMEEGMLADIQVQLQIRFIPYIQLHEFEGLLFCNIDVFNNGFEENEFLDYNYLVETIDNNQNPELINDSNITAPSKRLTRIIKDYSKVTHGSLIAQDIGINKIRNKCPRFNKWISTLEKI
ncbi:DUF4276 family protein [Flavobacterium limnophilum]|uniref:DUF4276 family protein n=1 Tax=Flavobacterium limnophilum TaxID=3003262 RepID=UPI0022AC4A57|nr:DUF4276 family protein [Flavobacterium limnophilum]